MCAYELDDAPSARGGPVLFADRRDAGRRLAERLRALAAERPVVLGMPRGGVPVAAEVARALRAPLDVAVVRKVGAPQQPEFALGAVAEGGVRVLSTAATRALGLSPARIERLVAAAEEELAAQLRRYRGADAALELVGRSAVLVDDGLATGRSARAAIRSLRARGAARVLLAVPVAAPSSLEALLGDADEIVCLRAPRELFAVGVWYEDFTPTSDAEVSELLAAAAVGPAAARPDCG